VRLVIILHSRAGAYGGNKRIGRWLFLRQRKEKRQLCAPPFASRGQSRRGEGTRDEQKGKGISPIRRVTATDSLRKDGKLICCLPSTVAV